MVYSGNPRVILWQVMPFFAQIKGVIKSNYQRIFWAYFVEINVFRGVFHRADKSGAMFIVRRGGGWKPGLYWGYLGYNPR
jgi:hypothetical protein